MRFIKWVGIVVGVVALIAFGFYAYMGMLGSLSVSERSMGPYTIVYEDFTGPYRETGPVFAKVFNQLKNDGIVARDAIGIYRDDPRTLAEKDLRSQCGAVISQSDLTRLDSLKDRYKIKTIEAKKSIVAEFPIRNNLSYMLGPMKGYSALMEYAKEKGYSLNASGAPYEYYDMERSMIYFVMPLP